MQNEQAPFKIKKNKKFYWSPGEDSSRGHTISTEKPVSAPGKERLLQGHMCVLHKEFQIIRKKDIPESYRQVFNYVHYVRGCVIVISREPRRFLFFFFLLLYVRFYFDNEARVQCVPRAEIQPQI